jgi:hypothetical protein
VSKGESILREYFGDLGMLPSITKGDIVGRMSLMMFFGNMSMEGT